MWQLFLRLFPKVDIALSCSFIIMLVFYFWCHGNPMNFKRGVKDSCAERGSGSKVSISESGGNFFFPSGGSEKKKRLCLSDSAHIKTAHHEMRVITCKISNKIPII